MPPDDDEEESPPPPEAADGPAPAVVETVAEGVPANKEKNMLPRLLLPAGVASGATEAP